jgi:hypothetical protein
LENILQPKDKRSFQVDCSANPVGSLRTGADSFSVKIGQRISRFGAEEIWDSVIVRGDTKGDEITIRVLLCHPDWDDPQEIARIRSSPCAQNSPDSGQTLNCTLVLT